MLLSAEENLIKQIGNWTTIAAPTKSQSYQSGFPASQCQAFLLSSREFTWFVERWDVGEESGSGRLHNKKLYPAKVTGLNLPSIYATTLRWREETISRVNLPANPDYQYPDKCFQPGFGETIAKDNNRTKQTVTITNNATPIAGGTLNSQLPNYFIQGAMGRLMSIASYVDPELAAKYDAPEDGEYKDKSLNSTNYQEFPTYPPYTVYTPPNYS